MKSIFLAFQFLTIIPIKIKQINEKELSWSVAYYPLVGLFLGLFLTGINNLLVVLNFEQLASTIILIVLLAIITGGLHLDGLADSADAFLSRKNKEEMLRIMRDPHIGAMGVIGIICLLLLKISFLYSINPSFKAVSFLLMCVLSRWSMVFLMFVFPYARHDGKAKVYIQGCNDKIFYMATILVLVFVFFIWKIKGLLVFALVLLSAYIMGKLINRKIDGITGDTIGAVNELTEILVLFSVFILEKISL
jgi:adenosylcobinamide-GDP ribazoletransferase